MPSLSALRVSKRGTCPGQAPQSGLAPWTTAPLWSCPGVTSECAETLWLVRSGDGGAIIALDGATASCTDCARSPYSRLSTATPRSAELTAGGAVRTSSRTASCAFLHAGSFVANLAAGGGGGCAAALDGASVSLRMASLGSNAALTGAGGCLLALRNATLSVTDSVFSDNRAAHVTGGGYGGTIAALGASSVSLTVRS